VLGYEEGAVDTEEACLEQYRELDVLGSPFRNRKPFFKMVGSDQKGAWAGTGSPFLKWLALIRKGRGDPDNVYIHSQV
jgi:hypothetical protein